MRISQKRNNALKTKINHGRKVPWFFSAKDDLFNFSIDGALPLQTSPQGLAAAP